MSITVTANNVHELREQLGDNRVESDVFIKFDRNEYGRSQARGLTMRLPNGHQTHYESSAEALDALGVWLQEREMELDVQEQEREATILAAQRYAEAEKEGKRAALLRQLKELDA